MSDGLDVDGKLAACVERVDRGLHPGQWHAPAARRSLRARYGARMVGTAVSAEAARATLHVVPRETDPAR